MFLLLTVLDAKSPKFPWKCIWCDLSIPSGSCGLDDMEIFRAISQPDGMHFKILSNFSLSSLWSVELNQRSTLTHDTMSPCWVVQNWSCQSRGRSLKLINPSRPWCDFFLVKGWAGWQPVGWLVSLTSCSLCKSQGYCNTCKCLSQALFKRLAHCCCQIYIKMISKW